MTDDVKNGEGDGGRRDVTVLVPYWAGDDGTLRALTNVQGSDDINRASIPNGAGTGRFTLEIHSLMPQADDPAVGASDDPTDPYSGVELDLGDGRTGHRAGVFEGSVISIELGQPAPVLTGLWTVWTVTGRDGDQPTGDMVLTPCNDDSYILTCGPDAGTVEYRNPWFRVEAQPGTTMHRVVPAEPGVIIVPVRRVGDHDEVMVGLHGRYTLGGNGAWELPRGFMAHGETPVQAALRELHEETGIEASPDNATVFLDGLHADTGLIKDDITVVRIDVDEDDPQDGHDEEFKGLSWVDTLVTGAGGFRDALSLAALLVTGVDIISREGAQAYECQE